MKIIEKTTMPNGTKIQLEDWTEDNTPEYPDTYGFTIGAYPTARNNYRFTRRNETFRLDISANKYRNYTNEDVKADFESLKNGTKQLNDLSDYFWNGKRDMYVLGMIPEYDEH